MLLDLTVGTWDYDRVAPLRDGRVSIEGVDVRYVPLRIEELFHRIFRNQEFDIAEMSLSAYMTAIVNGPWAYRAIPVFLSRMFRHSAIFIRDDRGIVDPTDLRGKRIGVPEYSQTAGITARGILEDDFSVTPADIRWVNGGLEEPGREEKFRLQLPSGVVLESATNASLSAMLEAGDLDGLISAANPSCFRPGGPIRRLFSDYRAQETAYYLRTGVFPIMHVVGIRSELVERHPWLAVSVVKAFTEAKRIAMHDIDGAGGANKTTIPWLPAEVEEARALMGEDWWPYGVSRNRTALETAARWSFAQGLTSRHVAVDELFVPSTLTEYKI